MQHLHERAVGSEKMVGVARIYFPGETEQPTHEERLASGIPFVQEEIEALNQQAEMVQSQKIEFLT